MNKSLIQTEEYRDLITELKRKVHSAQIKAALQVNEALIGLYWEIGRLIVERQQVGGWGNNVIGQIAKDLTRELVGAKGFSERNLYRMKLFFSFYADQGEFPPQLVAKIPWSHNALIIQKIKDQEQALWYVQQTIENGWSREQLNLQLHNQLYQRQAEKVKADNFDATLPAPYGTLVRDNLKDPYNLAFLGLGKDARERELEDALVNDIVKFMLELGKGFAFVGKQYPLRVGSKEYFIDMLFYHLRLRCYTAIELKIDEFRPIDAGQLNFYLTALDKQVKHPDDQPSIGMIFCPNKDATVVEYALQSINKPIHVPVYELTKALPEALKDSLPTTEEVEAELARRVSGQDENSD